ncbi:MAG: AI-2E family transporter, partial [Candidatus Liptonbacteria bacterium]
MDKHTIDISWTSLWRVFFFILLVAIMFLGRNILLGLFLAIVISSGLEFMVNFLERRRIPRTVGVITIFLLAVVGVIFLVYTVIPVFIVDINTAFTNLGRSDNSTWIGSFLNTQTTETFNSVLAKASAQLFGGNSSPFQTVAGIFGSFALALSVIVSSFYLSLSRDGVERFIRAVFPSSAESVVLRIYSRSLRRVGTWFRTQILLSALVGALVFVILLILGVRYAFLIAAVSAVLEIVPFIGPIISGSIGVLVAFTTSPALALYTLIAFLGIHQIENHIFIPLLFGRNTGLHPVIVIIALLIGLEVGGILGMIISVPAAVVIQEVVEEWSGRKRREESGSHDAGSDQESEKTEEEP